MNRYLSTLQYFLTVAARTKIKKFRDKSLEISIKDSGKIVLKLDNSVLFKRYPTGEIYFSLLGKNTPEIRTLLRFMGVPISSKQLVPLVNSIPINAEGIYLYHNEKVIPVAEWESKICFSAEEANIQLS